MKKRAKTPAQPTSPEDRLLRQERRHHEAARRAAKVVQDRFGALLLSTSGILEYDDDFLSDIEEIAEFLGRDNREERTPEQVAEDAILHWGEAGYLVGVQVGLHLRGGVQ